MIVAEHLRKDNIAEYLLYMWQVEDMIRAFDLDFDRLREGYLSRFSGLTPEQQKQQEEWYANLIDMMHREGVTQKGHLQLCRNVLIELEELHARLMASSRFPYYHAAYAAVLPAIVGLRHKNGSKEEHELVTCFNFLYGIMLLRLQKKEVSNETEQAVKTVTAFLGTLADYYRKDKEEPLEF